MATPQLASVDGAISATAEATIPLPDDGLYRGDGVFEVIRLYQGKPFELKAHLDRLERSAATIELPVDRTALEREVPPLLDRLGAEDAALRVIVTRGGRRLLLTEPLPPRGDTVRLATVAYSPSEILNGVKSLSYAANMQATRSAQARDADEALLVRPDGVILEAPTSSLFWVAPDGRLHTPAIDCGILESITRRRIIEVLQVEEGAYGIAELRDASEAFLASTTREVQPVAAIDGTTLGAPGPRTLEAIDAFGQVLAAALRD